MIIVRAEKTEDFPRVRRVNELAFGLPNEADLVDALRESGDFYISLVAVKDEEVIGHIFFSPVSIESEGTVFTALGLGPMAVLPRYQRQGIGSELVRKGLKECQSSNHNVVVVLGHPEYYPRFGFFPAKQKGLRCEYDVPDEAFMVVEFIPGTLDGSQAVVKYRPEFSMV